MVDFFHRNEHMDDQMVKVEVNLDDISGEWLGFLMDKLLEIGVNDVYYTPIFMKKNRPGILLSVLCSDKLLEIAEKLIFEESTTLGIRYYPLTVHRLERHFFKVQTEWGEVSIKQGLLKGKVVQTAPEYEDCKKIADVYQIPLKKVFQKVWSLI